MDRLINALVDQWLFDVEVMSEPWMYGPLLIPILCYLVFFFAKWAVLTAPVWLPVTLIFKGLRDDS